MGSRVSSRLGIPATATACPSAPSTLGLTFNSGRARRRPRPPRDPAGPDLCPSTPDIVDRPLACTLLIFDGCPVLADHQQYLAGLPGPKARSGTTGRPSARAGRNAYPDELPRHNRPSGFGKTPCGPGPCCPSQGRAPGPGSRAGPVWEPRPSPPCCHLPWDPKCPSAA